MTTEQNMLISWPNACSTGNDDGSEKHKFCDHHVNDDDDNGDDDDDSGGNAKNLLSAAMEPIPLVCVWPYIIIIIINYYYITLYRRSFLRMYV